MLLGYVSAALLANVAGLWAPLVQAAPAINARFAYGSSKVRGVNLGGWLVLEVLPRFSLLPVRFAMLIASPVHTALDHTRLV
jgi:hypothetical protein